MTETTLLALLAGSVIGKALGLIVADKVNEAQDRAAEMRAKVALAQFKRDHDGKGPCEFWSELLDPRIAQTWRDSGCTGPG